MRGGIIPGLSLGAVLAAATVSATAAQLAFDDGDNLFSGQDFGGLPTLPGFNDDITLPTFDTGLGTLDSATLNWFSTLTLSGDAIDGNVIGAAFVFSADGSIEVFDVDIDTGPLSVADSCLSIGCDVLGVVVSSTSPALNLTGELDLTAEPDVQTAGPGSFDVELLLTAGLGPFVPEFDEGGFAATWDVTMIVTYEFTPVPLPPAAALLAPAGLLLVRRRRRPATAGGSGKEHAAHRRNLPGQTACGRGTPPYLALCRNRGTRRNACIGSPGG